MIASPRPRKFALKFKLGQPLPIPRALGRGKLRHMVELPGTGQFGIVVERAPRTGDFTRTLVSICGHAYGRPDQRADARERAEVRASALERAA